MSAAQRNPRLAPSFMMVRLTGPTGIESNSPLSNPVKTARRIGLTGEVILILFLLNLPPHLARNPRPDEAVDQIKREEDRQDVEENFVLEHQNQAEKDGKEEQFYKRAARSHPQGFETGILHSADHHRRKEQQHDDQQVIPVAQAAVALLFDVNDQQRKRSDQARRGWDGKTEEVLAAATAGRSRQAVESSQSEGAANQVDRRNKPAQFRVRPKNVFQHHPMHQKGGGRAEGNHVGQRIELASERAINAAHAGDAAIE